VRPGVPTLSGHTGQTVRPAHPPHDYETT
jgi:hypothetical protein